MSGWDETDDQRRAPGGPAGGYAHLAPYEEGYPGGRRRRAPYDEAGYDETGYDETGYDEAGYDEAGYDEAGSGAAEGHLDEHGHWVYDDQPLTRRHSQRRARRPRRRHPVLTAFLALVVVVVLVAVGLFYHFDREIDPGGHPGHLVSVTIPAGATTAQIGSILSKAGVIHGASLFRYYVKLKGAGPLLPGTYQLAVNEKYDQAISALSAGPPVIQEKLVIPEGFTLQEIASRVAALPGLGLSSAKFLAAASSGQVRSPFEPTGVNDLEGLVFPATYEVQKGQSEVDVLQSLVARFDQEATSLNLVQAAHTLGLTPYQVITVASIVEREAKLDVDRGPVASALYNRLKAGMPLGADSTLVYALRQSDPTISVGSIDYNQPNPYNTRLNTGLPPTPISNPGVPSLTAAIAPPATTYLYFVETNPDGKLSFASTESGFSQLQAQCQQAKLC